MQTHSGICGGKTANFIWCGQIDENWVDVGLEVKRNRVYMKVVQLIVLLAACLLSP